MDEKTTRDLEIIIELFRKGDLRDLVVRGPELSLRLSVEPDSGEVAAPARARAPRSDAARLAAEAAPPRAAAAGGQGAGGTAADGKPGLAAPASAIDPAWTAVIAPNLGTFYRSPKPGSPAFVEVGQAISAGTEVCLIEVMKLFTSVRAEVSGVVRHIAAEDAQLVEGGQPLIYIEAD